MHNVANLPEHGQSTEERHLKIRQEAVAWRSLPEEERRRYGDKFVAVRGGKVVDGRAINLLC